MTRPGYRLAVELHAGIDRTQVQRTMNEAHKTCPSSKTHFAATLAANQTKIKNRKVL